MVLLLSKDSTHLKDKANMARRLRVNTPLKVKASMVHLPPVSTVSSGRPRVALLKVAPEDTQVSSSMANHLKAAGTRGRVTYLVQTAYRHDSVT
jgi:hypothetical protein